MTNYAEKIIPHTFQERFTEAAEAVKDQSKNIKASGKDWVKYVISHPLQSLLFGATIGLAFRGLLK